MTWYAMGAASTAEAGMVCTHTGTGELMTCWILSFGQMGKACIASVAAVKATRKDTGALAIKTQWNCYVTKVGNDIIGDKEVNHVLCITCLDCCAFVVL